MTVEEMTDTLARLGVEVIDSRGDELNGYCSAHEERTGHVDHNPSWWINADSGAFICFSCGWKGNLYTLIGYVTGIDYDKVNEWIGSPASMVSRFNRLSQEKKPVIEDVTHVTESMLSAFVNPPEHALQSRGLTSNAAFSYGLLWDERQSNWIIPIRDPNSEVLLGWQEKGYTRRYFNNRPSKVKKSQSLYGYRQYVGGDMIVVESPLDVVRLASIGIFSGVATYGAIVSQAQFNIIRGADRIIFAMDNDEAGRKSSMELLRLCQEFGVECWFFNYSGIDVKDVGGMSKAEVLQGLQKAKHLIRGEKAIV
jgi:DNA primase